MSVLTIIFIVASIIIFIVVLKTKSMGTYTPRIKGPNVGRVDDAKVRAHRGEKKPSGEKTG